MSDYQTDEEKVEALKQWWVENGVYLIAGLVIGAGILFGWDWWKNHRVQHSQEAAHLYFQMMSSQGVSTVDTATLQTLATDYADTPYKTFAGLQAARHFVTAGDLTQAAIALQDVVDGKNDAGTKALARLRLARVQLAQGNAEQALQSLEQVTAPAYLSLKEEIRGDALLRKGDIDGARDAYDKALLTAGARVDFLQLKRDDLGNKQVAGT